jgi:RNA processing factor Prp31
VPKSKKQKNKSTEQRIDDIEKRLNKLEEELNVNPFFCAEQELTIDFLDDMMNIIEQHHTLPAELTKRRKELTHEFSRTMKDEEARELLHILNEELEIMKNVDASATLTILLFIGFIRAAGMTTKE